MKEIFKNLSFWVKLLISVLALEFWQVSLTSLVAYAAYLAVRKTIKLLKEKNYGKSLSFILLSLMLTVSTFSAVSFLFDSMSDTKNKNAVSASDSTASKDTEDVLSQDKVYSTDDNSTFKYVNYLGKNLELPKGEKSQDGTSNVSQIRNDFASTYDDCSVTAEIKNSTLYLICKEAEDNPYFKANENAIAVYTDFSLDNIKDEVKYIDIRVRRPSSRVHAVLDMSEVSTDKGRYFDTNYIRSKLK